MRTWDENPDTFSQQNRSSILTVYLEADSPPDEDTFNFDAIDQKTKYEYQDPQGGGGNQWGLAIQVTPPSCGGSEEQMLDSQPFMSLQVANLENPHSGFSVQTETSREHQDRLQQADTGLLPGICTLTDVNSSNRNEITASAEGVDSRPSEKLQEDPGGAGDPNTAPDKPPKQLSIKVDTANPSSESKEHLKPLPHKDRDVSEHWAKRRKLFKESKQSSSAGGSSFTSDLTEESVSEDTHSADLALQEQEDRGFYTETFYSIAWIFWGDDASTEPIRANLSTRTRPISIRERTVRINKGSGEYPWGFRIQFSKPIVVTEVDTNGAAEEAGLMVGDYVLAVNGVDVTSIPHSEAANLARQGPDVLTLTIGSDIGRGPNTPRPPCRGYLHKRTQSGLIKGWRKRWFVLTHDCCLYYYKHKRDEGKRYPLSSVKLEGAEVGPDDSLGKPFVFKCRPQSGTRVFLLCATSNQERKRWLEAMEKAILPITQDHVWVDVTRHNSNLPPLAVKSPDCLGLLHKMDRSKDMWVQHYCILKDACLYLYSGIRATHAQGGLYLQGYTVREQPHGSKKSTIELKPPSDEFKTFYLCAENPAENKRWMAAIKASVKKWLPLHHALQNHINRPPEEARM
uniref:PDZ and pleckstrin homology domains 1 n=2 Tax=Oryzias sinensis TaxID=183150 RepID=A0A8C7X410_9TELE